MDRRVYDNYVIQIAKHGSLTKAAAALGISQPALSSGLNSLEKEVGITIFNRRNTPITFTAEGEVYYDYIQRARTLASDMQKRIDAMQGNLDKQLTIGAPVAYTDSLISDAIVQLLEAHPEYQVNLKSAPLSELIEMASTGEINCFVSTSAKLPANFEKKQIKNERLFLCVPAKNPVNEKLQKSAKNSQTTTQTTQTTTDLSLLSGEQFILLEDGLPLQKEIEQLLKSNGIKARRGITVNQVSTAVNLAIRGAGICIASEDSLANLQNRDELCIYPLNEETYGRDIYIAYDRELVMPRACSEFIQMLTIGE